MNKGIVYLIKIDKHPFYKIGMTRKLSNRFTTLSCCMPFEIDLIAAIEISNPEEIEYVLHSRFSNKRIKGEWFRLNKADVNKIKKIFSLGKPYYKSKCV